ncbi:MAG: DUF5050 domain-containing protein [Candidatus Aminicenantes bacterium]|nr:DUF5050 domain-containing protein [Candidatus Aminicenantes bacterium]
MANLIFGLVLRASTIAAVWIAFGAPGMSYGQSPAPEGKVYWTGLEKGIHRSSLDGTNHEQLVKPEWSYPGDIALDVPGDKIYWTDRRVSGIYRSGLNGTNVEILVGDRWIESPLGDGRIDLGEEWGLWDPVWLLQYRSWTTSIDLDITGNKMYWTQVFDAGDYLWGIVARANLDGSNYEYLVEGSLVPEGIALDMLRGKMYWTDEGRIFRADLNGKNMEWDYFPTEGSDRKDIALDIEGRMIYWTNPRTKTINKAGLDGTNIEKILTVSDGYPEEIILDLNRGKMYWSNPGTKRVQRADLDGKNVEDLFRLDDNNNKSKRFYYGPRAGIALDSHTGRVYWTDSGPGTIQRADLDGENREVLFDPIVREPHGLTLDEDKMYWTDVVKGTIQRADLDGGNIEVLLTGLNRPGRITTDGNKIYWADSGTGKIQSANLDGSQTRDIVEGLDEPGVIALDRDRSEIYWNNGTSIRRSSLDGSDVKEILTMSSFPRGLALDRNRREIYWTSGATIFRSSINNPNVQEVLTVDFWGKFGGIELDMVGARIYWGSLTSGHAVDFNSPSPAWVQVYRSNLDGSEVEMVYSGSWVPQYPSPSIALDITYPTLVSATGDGSSKPATSSLEQNVPNPFNSTTRIPYRLASSGSIRLEIYNTLGQRVRTLVEKVQPAGSYEAGWDARDQEGSAVAAGVYLARLRYPGGMQTRRLLFLK